MAIVDERGRLFGRWNLLDLAALILLVGLIPLAYAAYALFHDRPPSITSITPAQALESAEFRFTIKGRNFRPYMRASAGNLQAREFLFKSTEEAELPFAYLPPGVYDIVLYDSAQERFRLPKALTITRSPLPSTKFVAVGAFGNLDAARAAMITPGTALGEAGTVIAVGKPVADVTQIVAGPSHLGVRIAGALGLPATVELNCSVRVQGGTPFCAVGDTVVAPNILLTLTTPAGETPFQIVSLRGTEPVESVTISARFTGPSAVLSRIKRGDVDMGGTSNELAEQARVESVGAMRSTGEGSAAVDVRLTARMQRHDQTWIYDSATVHAGSSLLLRTAGYEARGIVTDIPRADSQRQ